MLHGVEKISTRATTLLQTSSRSKVRARRYDLPKSRDSNRDDFGTISGLQPGRFRDNFGTPTWESREFVPFGCSLDDELQRILYGGRWWLPPSPGRGESCVSKCSWQVPTPKGVPNAKLVFGCRITQAKLVPLPSLIPGLPTRPSTPF